MNKEKCTSFFKQLINKLGENNIKAWRIDRWLEEIESTLKDLDESDKKVKTNNIFLRTLKTLYSLDTEQVYKIYKVYFYEMMIELIKEGDVEQIIPEDSIFTHFYVFENNKIYKYSISFFRAFFNSYEEIEKDSFEFKKAYEMKEKMESGEQYIVDIW